MIEGATAQVFEPQVSDYYHVVVTSQGGCSSEASNEIYATVVGVETVRISNSLGAFVNASTGNIHVDFSIVKNSPVQISLLNILGQQTGILAAYNEKAAGNHSLKASANDLKPGIYFIRLQAGDYNAVRKIVISE